MKKLFIAEKAKVGRAIAAAIGGSFKQQQGYLVDEKAGIGITWCSGHMLELFEPEDYDPAYKRWSLEQLPFCFTPYKKKPSSDKSKKEQLKIIKALLEDTNEVIHAGDPDDEGQLIVDDVIRHFGFKKPVKRVFINDNNAKVIIRALEKIEDNKKYEAMGYQAEARSVGDQTLGLNFTRAYTQADRAAGNDNGVISAGRVQSAILGLIARRTIEFSAHKESYYYAVSADFDINGIIFNAKYKPSDEFISSHADKFDDKKRIIDEDFAKKIVADCNQSQALVNEASTKAKSTPPPLPYNLIKLQQEASGKFNYDPKDVMKITQSLKDKDLITYNRTDSQYLNDDHFQDAGSILSILKNNTPSLSSGLDGANPNLKGRVFDSSKTTAHHAIIPSETNVDISTLSVKERNIYLLIAEAYIVQFYADYEYLETQIVLNVGELKHSFATSSRIATAQGWKEFLKNSDDESGKKDDTNSVDLRPLSEGDKGLCNTCKASQEKTKPKALYTMKALLADLTSASKYIRNPKLAKILKDRDKDKVGESGGIGTPATRDSIIELLFKRNFIEKKGKNIISTEQGEALYNKLSDIMRYPDLSAIWVEKFKDIETADDVISFLDYVMKANINPAIALIKKNAPEPVALETSLCPVCKTHNMTRRNGKYGWYWGCLGYGDKANPCKNIMDDVDGKPVAKAVKQAAKASGFDCGECNRPLVLRKGANGRDDFWGCSGFFDKKKQCKQTYKDDEGKPIMPIKDDTADKGSEGLHRVKLNVIKV